jgi:hypothetical protein
MTTFFKRLAVIFIGVNVIDIIVEFFYAGNFEATILSGSIRRFVFMLIGAVIISVLSMVFDPPKRKQADEI